MTMRTKLPLAWGDGWGEGRFVAALVLLLTSCLNPDDIFPLKGRVETPGQRVTLERGPRATADECGEDYVSLKETDADENGDYGFEIFRAQAQSLTTGLPFCFRVTTAYASGTTAWGATRDVQADLDFPLLPDWRAQLTERENYDYLPDGGRVVLPTFFVQRIAYSSVDDVGFLDRYSVELTRADGVVQWRQGTPAIDDDPFNVEADLLTADGRVIREFDGGTLRATGSYNRATQLIDGLSGEVRVRWSPTISATSGDTLFIDGPALTPPSRGATCDGYASCPFTDGELAPAAVNASAITLRFAQPISARLVVLRGVVTPFIPQVDDEPRLRDGVVLAAFDADGGSVTSEPGFGGVLASANFTHEYDGAPRTPDGGAREYPPTYLAIPVSTSAPISSLRLTMPAVRVDEVSVW